MALVKIGQNAGSYLMFALIILGLVALLACAGLFIRHSFSGGTAPQAGTGGNAAPARAPVKPVSPYAGRYSGYTTIQTGICSLGIHEFVMDIDDNGNVRSSYAMKDGQFMTGTVGPNGKVKLRFRENGETIQFEGTVQDGHVTGTSSASEDKTCTIFWDLARN